MIIFPVMFIKIHRKMPNTCLRITLKLSDTDTLPAPAAIQEGYGIKVSFFPSHACFNVTEYRIQIYSEDSKVISHSALIEPPKVRITLYTVVCNIFI